MTPADLPRFHVQVILADRCTGRFDPSPWIGDNWIAGLYVVDGRFLWGRFRDVDQSAHTCSFFPSHPSELGAIHPSQSYPFMDGYWGKRAELVLDESRSWQQTVFQPSDMVLFPAPGGSMGRRLSPGEAAQGQIVPEGWDHEHCEICNKKIGRGGEPEGVFSRPDAWVCQDCHTAFVIPRSLAFVRASSRDEVHGLDAADRGDYKGNANRRRESPGEETSRRMGRLH